MSPGDASYDQPYFYVNPWPHPPADRLPPAIPPGHRHTEGFIGSVATGTELLSTADPDTTTRQFLQASFAAARAALGTSQPLGL